MVDALADSYECKNYGKKSCVFHLPIIRNRAERILSAGVFFLALCATYGGGVRNPQKVEAAINQPSLAHLK